MAVAEECTKLWFLRRRYECFDNLWYSHDGTVVGKILRLVWHEEVSSWYASRSGFRKAWGTTVSSKKHVTSTVSYNCIGVRGGVVKQLLWIFHFALNRLHLLWCNRFQCRQHGCVHRSSVVEERSSDLLNEIFICLTQDFWHVLLIWKLGFVSVDRFGVGVGLVLWITWFLWLERLRALLT